MPLLSALPSVRCLSMVGLALLCLPAPAEAEVIVALADGRTVRGGIDLRTSEERLWLCSAEPGILLRSSFAWHDVVAVTHEGQVWTAEAFRPLALKLKSGAGIAIFQQPRPLPPPPPPHAAVRPGLPPQALPGELPPAPRVAPRPLRVGSLHVDGAVANWDNDPEDDGLLVSVYPLTTDGLLLPVDGQLNLKLFGRETGPSLDRPLFPELTRGSLRVRAEDFGPDGAVYKFPFRNFHPEKDLDIDFQGLLSARLNVAGQGAFDASDDNVQLRRLSRFRDHLQLDRGRRFLPAENSRRLP